MNQAPNLLLLIAVQDIDLRGRLGKSIAAARMSLALGDKLPGFEVLVKSLNCKGEHAWDQKIEELLKTHFNEPGNAAILISDLLTHGGDESFPLEPEPTSRAKAWQEEFGHLLYGTLAIAPSEQKILDIDRVITSLSPAETVLEKISLIARRLQYLKKPMRQNLHPGISVRLVRDGNETDFQEYFRMRHQIYVPMGYLPREIEESPSRMDMDWCDMKSIHIGAYLNGGQKPKLIGTARVITMRPINVDDESFYRRIAGDDFAIQNQLNEPLGLGLPMFESQDAANNLMTELLTGNGQCGELSRVTVAPQCRGMGVSQLLIERAMEEARIASISRIFLECLEIHQSVYAKLDFERVPGLRGKVIGVDRTMIVMQDSCPVVSAKGR